MNKTIKNLRNKVMRTAWELFRTTGLDFRTCLKQAWKITKDSFAKIELQTGRCFLENFKNVYRQVERPAKEINKEFISNVVFLVDHFKRSVEFDKRKAAREAWEKEVRANNNVVVADSLIGGYKFD